MTNPKRRIELDVERQHTLKTLKNFLLFGVIFMPEPTKTYSRSTTEELAKFLKLQSTQNLPLYLRLN